jgi:hypothetical protein
LHDLATSKGLREEDGLRVKGPQIQGVYQMYVNQLFLPNMKAWDREKIEALFADKCLDFYFLKQKCLYLVWLEMIN